MPGGVSQKRSFPERPVAGCRPKRVLRWNDELSDGAFRRGRGTPLLHACTPQGDAVRRQLRLVQGRSTLHLALVVRPQGPGDTKVHRTIWAITMWAMTIWA